MSDFTMWPNHALQRTRHERRGCNRSVLWAGSLSLGRYPSREAVLPDEVICSQHGRQGIGLVCTHIAHAVDSGQLVGFFWGDDADTARPDAWCYACEQALLAVPKGQPTDKWFLSCDYKIFCAACWDHAKFILYDQQRIGSDG